VRLWHAGIEDQFDLKCKFITIQIGMLATNWKLTIGQSCQFAA